MIAWLIRYAPGVYVIGGVAVAVGGGLLWHVAHEWRRVRVELRRAEAIARQDAVYRHPAHRRRHEPMRTIRTVVRAVAPRPRRAPDPGALPGLGSARMLLPVISRAEEIPGQRAVPRA
ncbi:hypothetical protein OOJ91_11955 [Micromonospora lupini]|uniref:hypothetical protein n=1 Tax=Micromonospora lupini TaxID=285679 RepID=UPI0022591B58|nr:hypothetical protein [Micromonospora lupini]MCX5066591.1 hypothetical protein [Micromonospora lupini]